jgi:hypothetical protein
MNLVQALVENRDVYADQRLQVLTPTSTFMNDTKLDLLQNDNFAVNE